MGYIPGGREVERSLKDSQREVISAVKQINGHAAKLLQRGDYSKAEGLITVARQVGEFEVELEGIRRKWREILRGSSQPKQPKEKSLPLWKYYPPTLKILIELGGRASKDILARKMESRLPELFPVTETVLKGKRPRWAIMMRLALGAMEKEGFVQRIKNEWLITPSGRKAAESTLKEE